MKPLNRAERNGAFLSFLLLFLVTVVLIVTVIFFSIEVPVKENRQLRQTMVEQRKEKQLSDSFNLVMKEAMIDLNRFNEKKESPAATNQRVQNKVVMLNNMLKYLPNGENSIYALMVQNLSDLNTAKMKLASN